jgi:hypothetical protein
MFKPAQYRAKASEYGELANTSTGSEQKRDFQKLEQRFAVLADNEQWLADNYQNTVHAEQGPIIRRNPCRRRGAHPAMSWGSVDHAMEYLAD